jgi:hypothetical protein
MPNLITLPEVRQQIPGQTQYEKPRISRERLTVKLMRKPPRIEYVSHLEVWRLDEEGDREKRICGRVSCQRLPQFIPEGIPNPHGVVNPRNEYRCTFKAGFGTGHLGLGPCRYHAAQWVSEKHFTRYYCWVKEFDELVKNEYLKGEAMGKDVVRGRDMVTQEEGEEAPFLKVNIDEIEERLKKEIKPEDLIDPIRQLYTMEAVKRATMDLLRDDGVSMERLESVANQIVKAAQFQAAMAKRDATIMQSKTVAAMAQVFITGMLHIVSEVVGPDRMADVLQRFKDDLYLPINEYGVTELLRRQQAAGISDRIAVAAEVVEEEA